MFQNLARSNAPEVRKKPLMFVRMRSIGIFLSPNEDSLVERNIGASRRLISPARTVRRFIAKYWLPTPIILLSPLSIAAVIVVTPIMDQVGKITAVVYTITLFAILIATTVVILDVPLPVLLILQ